MQQQMEELLIYGAGGLALLFYAAMACKMGRIGFGNRFLRFGRAGYVERQEQPRRFWLFVSAYVLVGCLLLGAAVKSWLD